ncbi:MAG: tannase/feruloyl esterase family alpha/beta hydrolase [Terriglobia bacterium]
MAGVIKPTADSDIKFEVWMPVSGWNKRFQGVGNGGFAGSIQHGGLADALRRGFAVASTDTGHTGSSVDARWALGHPEKVIDFGYRGIHQMTVQAKAIIQAFYGVPPRRSYFASCSNGGRQALMEAQRFPADYDGIIAGAPANFWTQLQAVAIWDAQATLENAASYIPAGKLPAISSAVLAACDAKDGVADGILNDPRQCHFNPAKLLCRGADSNGCLTAPQVIALKKIYSGPRTSKGKQIFPGFSPGGELGPNGWAGWVTGSAPQASLQFKFGTHFFAYMVFNNPAWDYRTSNIDTDFKIADQKLAHILNATDPNPRPFKARGGKLIMYHGWSDAAIPPLSSIKYYKSVVAAMGLRETEDFLRLFMAPGMQHCGLGPGPGSFGGFEAAAQFDAERNMFDALERWVEDGVAPDKIITTKYMKPSDPASGIAMTRPLCAYPEVAKYKGSGDTKDAANFACVKEARR